MYYIKLTRSQLADNFERVANDFYRFIKDNGLERTEVSMSTVGDLRSPDLNLCDTPACHGGWAAIMYGVKVYGDHEDCKSFYELGAHRIAKELGFKDKFRLQQWARRYPKYWGNDEGGMMFGDEEAFDKELKETLHLKDIADWYMNVAKRLRRGKSMKPMLAVDADLDKIYKSMIAMPKIDGVRALNVGGSLVARSGKPFKNILNTELFSNEEFAGFDGEMVAGKSTDENLCSATTSAMNTIKGDVVCDWYLFDYIPNGAEGKTYTERLDLLKAKVESLEVEGVNLYVIEQQTVSSKKDVQELEAKWLDQGYEGLILRDPSGQYKHGRTTQKEANYLRVKTFMDSEIVVTGLIEGQSNSNVAKKTPNGYTERSTHKENMKPNGMVGAIVGKANEDVVFNGKVIVEKGQEIEISAGKLTHKERKMYMENPDKILGKLAKYQFFPVGIKDKPRFPTFQCFRDPLDL